MCEPVTITMGVMAAAGAATSIMGQQQQRQANKGMENQKKLAQDDLIIENRRRATHDYLREVRLEQRQQSEETADLAVEAQGISRGAASARSTTIASAAERGVAGSNLDILLADFDFQQAEETGRLRINQARANQQHGENIEASRDQFSNRVSAVKPYVPRVQPPVDYLGPVFSAVGQTMQTGVARGIGTGSKMPTAPVSEVV
jgi:hypothetical protein